MLSILGFPWFPTWRGGGLLLGYESVFEVLKYASSPNRIYDELCGICQSLFLRWGGGAVRRWIPKPFSHSDLCICFEIVNISFKYICWNGPVLLRFFLNLLSFATINKPFNGCSSTFSIMKTWQVFFFCRRGSLCNFSSNVIVTWLSNPCGGSGGKTSRKGVRYCKVGETFESINVSYRKQTHCGTVTLGR